MTCALRRLVGPAAFAGATVLAAAVTLLVGAASAHAQLSFDPDKTYRVPVGESPSRGPRDALVTIVEFSDFACGFCGRVRPTLDTLFELYPGEIRLVYKQRPLDLDREFVEGAEASYAAAAQGMFWQMHDRIFDSRATDRRSTTNYARELGLDMARFRRDMDSHAHRDKIAADLELAESLGVGGTPMFFINGRPLSGARPPRDFIRLIDDELKRARRKVASGVPAAGVYEAIIADGETSGDRAARPRQARRQLDRDAVYPVPMGPNALVTGPADALVTIVTFEDFECPYCARNAEALYQLRDKYPRDVRLAFRHFPLAFHRHAMGAAEAAMAAHAQGKFWEMHRRLFENQNALGRADLERYAAELNLDMDAFRAALDQGAAKAAINADLRDGMLIGVTATPTAFINGTPVAGALPIEALEMIVEAKRRQARALVAKGVARKDLYDHIINSARAAQATP